MSGALPFADAESGREEYAAEDGASFERNLVFVAMDGGGAGRAEAFAAISDECSKLGLRVMRFDDGSGTGNTIKQIADLVRRAEFLIVDLTGRPPHAYYALGYAHGVGNEALDILLVAQEGSALGFDAAPSRAQIYRSTAELRGIVAAGLSQMIQHTRG